MIETTQKTGRTLPILTSVLLVQLSKQREHAMKSQGELFNHCSRAYGHFARDA